MPFGAMFGAVVFGVLCLGWGGRLLPEGAPSHRLVTILWGALGLALPVGLLLRQSWARWAGTAAAALLAVVGARLVLDRGEVGDHLVLLAALVTAVLLILPATGNLRRSAPERASGQGRLAGSLGLATFGLVLSLAALSWPALVASSSPGTSPVSSRYATGGDSTRSQRGAMTTMPASEPPLPSRRAPAPESGPSVSWASFGTGARRAKDEGRPMFVDFYATWCGMCKRMDRQTYRDPEVVRALAELIPVRVDSEDETSRDGFRGSDLAVRHAIRGYPTLVLFDSNGREISRRAGYLEPRAFLAWIDASLRSKSRASTPATDALRAGR